MFSTSSKAERTAEQAWEYLTSAMSSVVSTAGDTASKASKAAGDRASKAASLAGDRGQDLAGEAWRRANAAADALAGRRAPRPWGLVLAAGLAGVAVGWAAAAYSRRALARRAAEEEQELAETAVIVTGDR